MFHNKDKLRLLDLVKLKLVMKHTCFLHVDIVACIIFIGKGIPPNKHAIFCLLSFFFALNVHRVHIHVSHDVLLHSCFKKAIFK